MKARLYATPCDPHGGHTPVDSPKRVQTMTTLVFLINLGGATFLLLYAVRMVQTGIERAMGPSFRRIVTAHSDSHLRTALAGVLLAIILQSSTAAGLLASGFAATSLLTFSGGLAVVLGADFGSALVIQILSFRPDWLIPILLVAGGYLFLKVEARTLRQWGRILLGIAFILLALRFIGDAVHPIRDSPFMPAIAGYLKSDFITAFLVGAAVTFIMHSSVAAILMTVTFVVLGVLSPNAGVSVVLGANLGAATLLIWLSRDMVTKARRIPIANLVLRGTGAVLALFLVNLTPVLSWLEGVAPGQRLVLAHMGFNALVLLLSFPLLKLIERPLIACFPGRSEVAPVDGFRTLSALDRSVVDRPSLALASLTRELLRMTQIVEVMAGPVMDYYESGDEVAIKATKALDFDLNRALDDVRRYVALVPREGQTKEQYRRVRELVEYAISLETAGDIIAKGLLSLAVEKNRNRLKFSQEGHQELALLHERVMANMKLAFNVLLSEDIESARLLLEEKSEMATQERKSRKRHLKRLREGAEESLESSDIHLETLRALKDLNSQIAAIAYPILVRGGQLLETRLVDNVNESDIESNDT